METATSIALSSRLITRSQTMYTFQQVTSRSDVHSKLNNLRKKSVSVLIITGSSLEVRTDASILLHISAIECQCSGQ